MFHFNSARRAFTAGFALTLLTVFPPSVNAKPAREAGGLWLSLGFSTLDEAPLDWNWLRSRLADEKWLDSLGRKSKQTTSIVVPVFEGGQAFFDTQTIPFAKRNPLAQSDEAALRRFLRAAKKRKMRVYLGFDALGWDKPAANGWNGGASSTRSIFDEAPELEELNAQLSSPASGARFASPWNRRVQGALESLVSEAARRFPEAQGAVFDVHLNRGEVSGFGSAARLAAKRELGLDSVALGIQGTVDETLSDESRRFVDWREKSLANFTRALMQTWKRHAANGSEVWLSGAADYGLVKGFDALRSGQNLGFGSGEVKGILLEGRWSEGDAARLKTSNFAAPFVPLIVPSISKRAPGLEWQVLGAKAPNVARGIAVQNESGERAILDFLSGKEPRLVAAPLAIGQIAPEIELVGSDAQMWSARTLRGKQALLIVSRGRTKKARQGWRQVGEQLRQLAPQLRLDGIVPVVVDESQTALSGGILVLSDPSRGFTASLGLENTFVFVDRAGFVREVKEIRSSTPLSTLSHSWSDAPKLEVGKMAPDFSVVDMNGQVRTLSSLRGKKSLLLSFFPKCFTGGCANHMASLSSQFEAFERANVEVLGVSIDAPDVQREFAARWKLRFPLVPDVGRQLCFLYDAVPDVDALATRQSVFVDKQGIVRFIDRDVRVASHGLDVMKKLEELGLL